MIPSTSIDNDESLISTSLADVRHLFEGIPERLLSRQYPWDNSGLQLECHSNPITGVTLCLDITPDVVSHALSQGHNLIISHHPIIFTPLKSISNTTTVGKILTDSIRNNINILSYHTNLDLADYSLSDYILDKVGLPAGTIYEHVGVSQVDTKGDASPLAPPPNSTPYGLGRVVNLPTPMTIQEIQKLFETMSSETTTLKHNFRHNVPTCGDGSSSGDGEEVLPNGRKPLCPDSTFQRLAVIAGAGFSSWEQCLNTNVNVDILVSGDLKHHEALDAKNAGIALLDIGHEYGEMPYLYYLQELLATKLSLHSSVVEKQTITQL